MFRNVSDIVDENKRLRLENEFLRSLNEHLIELAMKADLIPEPRTLLLKVDADQIEQLKASLEKLGVRNAAKPLLTDLFPQPDSGPNPDPNSDPSGK